MTQTPIGTEEVSPALGASSLMGVHEAPPEERPMGFLLGVENRDIPRDDGLSPPPVKAGPPRTTSAEGLRRLTPTECERLMGWPDGWTVA